MIREVNLYASISKFVNVHPMEKLLITLIPLLFGAYTEKYEVVIFDIITMILLGFAAKIPGKIIKNFIYVAVLFAFCSAIPLLLERQYEFIILLLLRAINGAIAISFLALTTPINHIVYLISKINLLSDVADIAKSLETFLIIIEKDFDITLKAVKSRGYGTSYIDKIKLISKACGVVFRNLLYRWKEINEGLSNRCYIGKYHYSYEFINNYKNYIFIIMYSIMNLILIKSF